MTFPPPSKSIQDLFDNQCYLFGSGVYKTISGGGTPNDYDFACPEVTQIVEHLTEQNTCVITDFRDHTDDIFYFRLNCQDVDKPIDISDQNRITKMLAHKSSVMQIVKDRHGYKHIHTDGEICDNFPTVNELLEEIKDKTLNSKNFDNHKHIKYFDSWRMREKPTKFKCTKN